MQAKVKTQIKKELWLQALVDSGYIYIEINKQLVKKEQIKIKPADIAFKVFNIDKTKNREMTWFAPLKIEINKHKEQIDIVVTDLNSMDMFLEHNWLVKHNLEVNWNIGTIQFTRCSKIYRTQYQNITFRTRKVQAMETSDKEQ